MLPVSARVAFQVLVQPGSYKVGPPSFPNPLTTAGYKSDSYPSTSLVSSRIVTALDKESLEWATKEQGSTHVSALLICLDRFLHN